MDLGIIGKRALIFGGSSGIGLGIAESLHREGVKVCISSRTENRLREVAGTMLGSEWVVADQQRVGESSRAVQEAVKKMGGVDILVLNTGGPPPGTFESTSMKNWETGIQGLFLSAIDAAQSVLPGMRAQGFGRIVLVGSISAREPIPGLTISNAIRAGLVGLLKSLSNEVADAGITVNCILPGFINTDRLKELGRSIDDIVNGVPMKRLGTVTEIGSLAAYLCSVQAAYITGQAIACDGGRLRSS